MTDWSDTLSRAMEIARTPGPELAPATLIAHLATLEDPMGALAGHDAGHALFEALDTDIGFARFAPASNRQISEEQLDRLAKSIRWLRGELSTWDGVADTRSEKLVCVLIVATRLDEDGVLWELLPDSAGANAKLDEALAGLIANARLAMATVGYSRSPILDRQNLDQYIHADQNRDWPTLRGLAEQLPFGIFTNVAFTQSVRYLQRFHFDKLIQATRTVAQTGLAMQIVLDISVEGAFRLARDGDNPYLQFAAVCRLFAVHEQVSELTPAEETLLQDLLLGISRDAALWASWMKAFNAHPARAGLIQRALGRCLANAGIGAAEQYMQALVMQTGTHGRDCVAACLSEFAEHAALEKRRLVWQLAYRRWSEWNFGERDGHSSPIGVVISPIDFAIVGYAVECLQPEQRAQTVADCLADASKTEDHWHASSPACMAYFYRALSRMQPFAHAHTCDPDRQSWLMNTHLHIPDDPKANPFWRLRYHMRQVNEVQAGGHPQPLT